MLKNNNLLIMKVYICLRGIHIVEDEIGSGFIIGATYEDYLNGAFILLTDDRNDFRLANPTASVREILAMELDPVVEPPEPPEPPDEKYTWQEKQDFIEGLMEGLGI